TLRGLLLAQRTESSEHDVAAGLAALERALEREEASDNK
ncbi:MAG: TetR/AcrR family transcriptional regulator, partial [Jatrophihabitans endophyticus]|nr:TetR/AcrR family transcriptional regulator [Jatrophihabitans endophyticus]